MDWQAMWEWAQENLAIHWPWLLGSFCFWVVGKFMVAQVWTKERAFAPGRFRNVWHFMRRTVAIHPLAAGFWLGGIPGIPVSPGVEGLPATMLYWGSAGLCSSFWVHALAQWVRKKTEGGLDLDQVGDNIARGPSMTPSAPPKGTSLQ